MQDREIAKMAVLWILICGAAASVAVRSANFGAALKLQEPGQPAAVLTLSQAVPGESTPAPALVLAAPQAGALLGEAPGSMSDSMPGKGVLIPDSELVYGPSTVGFDIAGFIQSHGGYLASYTNGAQVLALVSAEFSVNPRLLLAVLEYRSGWVTQAQVSPKKQAAPITLDPGGSTDLYQQLATAAMALNRGYYLRRNTAANELAAGSSAIEVPADANPGTVGLMTLFATLGGEGGLQAALAPGGFLDTYRALFGDPFAHEVTLVPSGLAQPSLELPFEPGEVWVFTGGPHAAWGPGSAWGALDFAPAQGGLGCLGSAAWVTAAAGGVVVRTGTGVVVVDLDGDGNEQTGWNILYMHVASQERQVVPGAQVQAGDWIGHPSCEGGVSTGTHVHLARKYNGEWIAADQASLPFNLGGWVSAGAGSEYNGTLSRGAKTLTASVSGTQNRIKR